MLKDGQTMWRGNGQSSANANKNQLIQIVKRSPSIYYAVIGIFIIHAESSCFVCSLFISDVPIIWYTFCIHLSSSSAGFIILCFCFDCFALLCDRDWQYHKCVCLLVIELWANTPEYIWQTSMIDDGLDYFTKSHDKCTAAICFFFLNN